MSVNLRAAALAASLLFNQLCSADEKLWVYATGADTMPAGATEFEVKDVIRLDKDSGDYSFHDIRFEIERGITDRFSINAEVLVFRHDYSVDDPDLNPMFETQGGAGERFKDTQYAGFEVGMKYNILSTYKDIVGLSVGAMYERRNRYRLDGAKIDQDSFEAVLYLQKDFFEDTLITVFNLKTEFERRKSGSVLEEEIALDVSAAIAYRFKPNWYIGLEFRHQSDYLNPQDRAEEGNAPEFDDQGFSTELDRSSFDLSDFRIGSRHQYGNYLGPTVHYATKDWWVNAGILWQISGGGSKFSFSTHGRNWDEHEKMHIGLAFGYELKR
ncbi:MAG: hypothetical protein KUG79_11420 [Pseudomonadales bacterium]|nr:hypothetical protein [Pseudomonadales bacterium]